MRESSICNFFEIFQDSIFFAVESSNQSSFKDSLSPIFFLT